ncbi:hypothetical protein H1Y58_002609 [Escherichia coli]|nr:hypothetical protein [Escherichia coli]
MTEAEILGLTRRAGGINRQHDEQAAQPDTTSRTPPAEGMIILIMPLPKRESSLR